MRIAIDQNRCEGHGQCAVSAPDIYALDDDGYVQVLVAELPEQLIERAKAGARSCPMAAIVVVAS
jgi:ferredoxin